MRNRTEGAMAVSHKGDPFILDDGAEIAVIGGGPTGSFFSIFALQMARMVGKDLKVTLYEPKDFSKDGPSGCNRCGGIISELLVQMLAVEGINLPDSVVQKGINSYRLHTPHGSVSIETPTLEKSIATVYRGGGPKGIIGSEKESFDNFLLAQALKAGAVHRPERIDRIGSGNGRPVLFSKEGELQKADLFVGACGVNSTTPKVFEAAGFGYSEPSTITAAIAEIGLDAGLIAEKFGNSINLFLLPDRDLKFAAMIPKGTYVTVCILGRNIGAQTVKDFLSNPVVRSVLPGSIPYKLDCRCLPKMNVGAPKRPFADRFVLCGDAGSTRLFKDGLGAAYLMGKSAAKTAVFEGVGRRHFQMNYYPVYRSIIVDNWFGKVLYAFTDMYRKNPLFCRMMLEVVKKEQQRQDENAKVLSSILWDMFTGNERYKNIFSRTFSVRMNLDQLSEIGKLLIRRGG